MLKFSVVLSVIAVVVLFAGVLIYDSSLSVDLHEATGLVVSTESFPVYLETHPFFKALPDKANVEISIGNNNYAVSGKTVTANAVSENPDLTVKLPESYTSRIGEVGLCTALKEAVSNGDIKISTELSKFELFVKYRGLLKYRSCLS